MEEVSTAPQLDPAGVAALGERLQAAVRTAVRVPREVLRDVIVAFLAEGHVLIEDYPGVGKTALARALSRSIDAAFARVQCTADLLPADVVGTNVYNQREQRFEFRPGPVFANVVLVDEVNRASPKTQSGLLECMQERHVTVDVHTHELARPFLVLATQNPVEYEGTYPLPEAQLDRFMLKLSVPYPSAEQEQAVLARHHRGMDPHDLAALGLRAVAGPGDLAAARGEVAAVEVDDRVQAYIVALVRATRDSPSLTLGASPRGATMLLWAAKAWAWLAARPFVTPDEVKAVAKPALRHRVALRPEVELEGGTADGVLDGVLASVPVPR
ncbi:MAG: AAA family ATPase [Thermoleophilaceae bacterium]